uniref:Uncharacterized protein n=1 Tax=Magallana gigas TaxID=29159 RepID=A0A8W8K4I1_MAGGI|nr:uncharacterized protein LOC105340201 isoform X1 [Crassostrea gigas]
MDRLGGSIFEIIEASKQPLSVDSLARKCCREKHEVKKSLDNLLNIGIIRVSPQGLWSLTTDDKDDLSQDAECYSGSLSDHYSCGQGATSQTDPMIVQTGLKVPLESTSSHDTTPKEPSNSASNVIYKRSPSKNEPKASSSHTRNLSVPHRKVSDTNGTSSSPIIQEVTLSGEADLCTALEATTLKEPVQPVSDNRVVPRTLSVVPRQNSNPTTIAVGGAVIETSGTVNTMQLSTVNPHKSIIERVIKLLQSSSEVRPLDVAKKCIGKTASKKDVNRYLHYLEKSGFVCVKYLNEEKKSNPVWSALPKARDITEKKIIELASEISKSPSKSRTQSELVPRLPDSSHQYPTSGNSTPYHILVENHFHQHKHTHNTVIQAGEGNSVHLNAQGIEQERERITEQEAENEI